MYKQTLEQNIQSHNLSFHCMRTLSFDKSDAQPAIAKLNYWLSVSQDWMPDTSLKPTDDKTELVLIGDTKSLATIYDFAQPISRTKVKQSFCARN